ncbi:hypothetical protein B566_EDAN010854 [Ephemera danica]|nr:hypothetical protein B566_EDAN010854 [Ephemera danica]
MGISWYEKGSWCVRESRALRDVRLEVPEAVRRGESVKLVCEYDLERAALYSIKWYKGDDEFYRFVPKEAPPTRVFPMPGVNVDKSSLSNDETRDREDEMVLWYRMNGVSFPA